MNKVSVADGSRVFWYKQQDVYQIVYTGGPHQCVFAPEDEIFFDHGIGQERYEGLVPLWVHFICILHVFY